MPFRPQNLHDAVTKMVLIWTVSILALPWVMVLGHVLLHE